MLKNYSNILLFDVETTGLDFDNSKIIEFGFVRLENGIEVEAETILINWYLIDQNFEIPELIQNLTNITPDMLKNEGISPSNAFEKISQLMIWADLYICHNITFDIKMTGTFLRLFNKHKNFIELTKKYIGTDSPDYIDTLLIVGDNKQEGRHRLEDACNWCGISLKNAHRAIDDIKATWELLKGLKDKNIPIDNYINKWGYYQKYHNYKEPILTKPPKVNWVNISFGKKVLN